MSARNSRNSRERSSGGSARRPRLDSSRRPKAFRGKNARNSNDFRAAANSVFADPNAGKVRNPKKRAELDAAESELETSENDFPAELAASADLGHRLQKVLAAAGFGSRRQCEELIEEGRVEVDGEIVSELGVRVFPHSRKIRVDGEALPKTKPIYVALNKPKNTLCTNSDPQGRRRVGDFIPEQLGRLFPIGRLDQNSEGLILLTNDGALAERLTHPRFEVPKKYRVQVAGNVDYTLVSDLKRGVHIAEGIVQADDVVIKSRHKMSAILEITLTEGKNREIRRMLARIGHKVLSLQRIQVGPIKLGTLIPGEFRRLDPREVAALYRAAERPRQANADETAPRRSAPIELAEIERRKEALEEERAAKFAKKGAKRPAKSDDKPKSGAKRSAFGASASDGFERSNRQNRGENGAPRRDARPEFREEFRSEERREDRRRARREFDDETRTIGPRRFDRSENADRRDRFNDDASAKRRVKRSENGERRDRFNDKAEPRRTPGAFGNRMKKRGSKPNGGGKRPGGKGFRGK